MSHRVEIRPAALADIAEAAAWYEEREKGLGKRLTLEIVDTIDGLSEFPLRYRLRNRRSNVRWCLSKNFPYRVIYRVTENTVTVVAVLHAARHERRLSGC